MSGLVPVESQFRELVFLMYFFVSFSNGSYDLGILTEKLGPYRRVYHHSPATPISDMAGELWFLIIQLAGKLKRADEAVPKIRAKNNREMVEEFIDAGDRLIDKLRKLFKACEAPVLRPGAKKQKDPQLGKNVGIEFVETYRVQIGYRGTEHTRTSPNYKIEDPDTIINKLLDDLRLNRVRLASKPSFIFLLGLLLKQDGGWRRIYDLFWPPGRDIN